MLRGGVGKIKREGKWRRLESIIKDLIKSPRFPLVIWLPTHNQGGYITLHVVHVPRFVVSCFVRTIKNQYNDLTSKYVHE